jgi:ATP-binding cassette subfamily B protein
MDTTLTREFDDQGAALSGGESQKIAIARVFAQDFEIALLDEPSSALDPVAEYELYESMMRRCADKTVLFISHRLSSATLADRVIVMDGGRIAEQGSHAELMAAGGIYARMFTLQAERYVTDNYATFAEEAE